VQRDLSSVSPEPLILGKSTPRGDGEDRLLHFVSDRLAQMDTGRQRRLIIYWAAAITAAALLCVLAWALHGLLPSST
jgi:hypothetical protein